MLSDEEIRFFGLDSLVWCNGTLRFDHAPGCDCRLEDVDEDGSPDEGEPGDDVPF